MITAKAFEKLQRRAQRSDAALSIANQADGSSRLVLTRGPLHRTFKADVSGIVSLQRLLAEIETEVSA